MKIHLYRIIGNDLPPRHEIGQSLRNVSFILDNEPKFEDCDRFWVINRIYDKAARQLVLNELETAGESYFEIPFEIKDYPISGTFRDKYHYVTNNNPARNFCLEKSFGSSEAPDIVMPFDGNCFFSVEGWFYARNEIMNNFYSPYFIVPMARCISYDDVKEQPNLREIYQVGKMMRHDITEPQIAFGKDHDLRFDPNRPYGEASKVDLLWKLGIPGVWDWWYQEHGGLCQQALKTPSKFITRNPIYAGYVYRLPSGRPESETNNLIRGSSRQEGLKRLVESIDREANNLSMK